MTEQTKGYEGWTILELLGHRRLGGYVTEQTIAGHGFLRLDVPGPDGKNATQFYSPTSVYALTPTTEETARAVAALAFPKPVERWELPQLKPRESEGDAGHSEGYEDDPDGDDEEF